MPHWCVNEPSRFWVASDKNERKNGVLFRQIEFALPREISLDDQQVLVKKYAEIVTTFQGGSLPFSLAIHNGKGVNPHCHLMLSERITDLEPRPEHLWFKRAALKHKDLASGGARKADISSQRKQWLEETRKQWADCCNAALEEAGIDELIDHRSYQRQGVEVLPQVHVGARLMDSLSRNKVPESLQNRLFRFKSIHDENQRMLEEVRGPLL